MGRGLGVAVGVGLDVAVGSGVGVGVAVGSGVRVEVGVGEGLGVALGLGVGVDVGMSVGVAVAVSVPVGEGVDDGSAACDMATGPAVGDWCGTKPISKASAGMLRARMSGPKIRNRTRPSRMSAPTTIRTSRRGDKVLAELDPLGRAGG